MLDALDPRWNALDTIGGLAASGHGADSASLATSLGTLTLAAFAPGIFRLRIGPRDAPDYGILCGEPSSDGATVESTADGVRVALGADSLTLDTATGRLALCRDAAIVLETSTDAHFTGRPRLPGLARSDDGWFLSFALNSGEPVYGLGEKWSPLNRRGQLVDSWTHDALGVNTDRSYKNTPFAWSPRGWGLFVHTPARVRHGIGHPAWSHRSYGLEVLDAGLDLFLIVGDPQEILARYRGLTGAMPMPPTWSLGIWYSKAYYRTPEEALPVAQGVRDRDLPGEVLLFDGRAWQDTATRFSFNWDPARFPDPKAVVDRLHDLDFKVCCWEYPLVSTGNPNFSEMEAKGWFLKDPQTGRALRHRWDLEPFGQVLTPLPESGIVDFTHPDAYAHWRDRHADLFAVGIDAMKPDFGEQVPDEALAHNGDTGARLHNVYPLVYNRCVFEATERAYPGEALVFSRAGWAGSQRYPIQWGGDPQSDWEGLAASLRGGLSWGLSGVPCYATDIGGFYGPQPDAELFVRWTQAAVFSSHMRFHGIGPREPWAFGEATEALLRPWLELRYRLLPYLRGTLREACDAGLPVQRAMVLAFPDDPGTWGFDDQFMFGRDLLVIPVIAPGGTVRYNLPRGGWRDFWTGETVEGSRVVDARVAIDRLPIFVRDGSPLALGPAVRHTGQLADRPAIEELRLYGAPARPPVTQDGALGLEDGRITGLEDGVRVVEMKKA